MTSKPGKPGGQESPTPLVDALLEVSHAGRDSWHMPGHRGGQAWPNWFAEAIAAFDLTELPNTDDINHPTGPVRQANDLAAAAFGAAASRIVTGGSTTALQVLLAATTGRQGQLLLPRASHQAVFHAAALLDLDLRWLSPSESAQSAEVADPLTLIPRITVDDIVFGLQANPSCRTVLLTSPDYYGACADLEAIADVAHAHGATLLVDEAHGAHLAFGGGLLPKSSLAAGADACVQSGHKTLPVLTPGAWLHVSAGALQKGRIAMADIDRLMPVFQTSSPSFAVAASLDFARAWLVSAGRAAIARQLAFQKAALANLPQHFIRSGPSAFAEKATCLQRDPLRLVIRHVAEAAPGKKMPGRPVQPVAAWLGSQGIDIEFADLTRMVLIPALDQPEEAWNRLVAALILYDREMMAGNDGPGSADALDRLEACWRGFLVQPPEKVLPAAQILFSRMPGQVRIALDRSAGRICARTIMPYPPGIPLIVPGERIDSTRVDFLCRLMENKVNVSGIDDGTVWVLA